MQRLRHVMLAFAFVGFTECVLVLVLTAWNPTLRKWPGAHEFGVRVTNAPPGSLVIGMALGQAILAFGVLLSAFGSATQFHCDPAPHWRNLCRVQGFFIVLGVHVTLSTYECGT